MDQPHGFQAVHARHEDIEKQQIEFTRLEYPSPLRPSPAFDNAVAARSTKSDGRLHCNVVSTTRICAKSTLASIWDQHRPVAKGC
jgi:hypothetical protein